MRQPVCYDCGATLTTVGMMSGDCPNCGLVFLDMQTAAERRDGATVEALIAAIQGQGILRVLEILDGHTEI